MAAFAAMALAFATACFAVDDVNLRTLAVTNADGTLKILWHGNAEWWNATTGEQAAFDGNTETMVDPKRVYSPTWVGYELTEPRVVTRIRLCVPSRTDYEDRLRSCRLEGANEPDFSDAIVLLDMRNALPKGWFTGSTYWVEAPAQQMATPQAFRYLRFIQHKKATTSGGDTEGAYYIGNVAELEFYGLDAESYAGYEMPAATDEVNLRLYAMHDATGALDILSDKTTPYGAGYEYTKAFDYKTSTFYDPTTVSGVSHYVGYALTRPMSVTRIRYCGRTDGRDSSLRLRSCRIEGANEPDFSDAVPLHLCAKAVPADWNSHPGWIEVAPDWTIGVSAFKYLRLVEPAGNMQCGDVSELEFYGMDADAMAARVLADPQPPLDFAVSRGAFRTVPAIFSWRLQTGVTDTTILRAPGLGGPWTEVAQLSGANSWTDTTAQAGSLFHYKAIANFSYKGEGFSVTNGTPLSFRRWRLLERDPDDMTHLRSGVSVIYKCGTSYWTGGSVAGSVLLPFDGNADTKCDVGSASPRTCIGVDLGEPAHFAYMRHYSSQTFANSNRLNGIMFSGSNSADWNQTGNFTDLIEPLKMVDRWMWYERESLDTENTYRYFFHHNPKNNGWNNNVWELQIYGWTESDLENLALGVEGLTVTYGATPSATVAWTPKSAYGTYTVERKDDGGEWTAVAEGLTASTTSWTDTSVTVDGTRYTYRVKTVNGEDEAYSLDCEARPYTVGNGTGLHGVWSAPYSTLDVGESVVHTRTDAAIDFENASVGGATEGFFVRWTGRLIAPFAGMYEFEADADDTLTLWIDGKPVLYRNANDGTAQTGSIELSQGEHDIVATWFQNDGDNRCRLYWGGAVARAVIPSTQLVPVEPEAMPEEWAGARTFSNAASVSYPGDVKFNSDGSFDMAFGGADLYYSENGYNFVWRPIAGDFDILARVEYLRDLQGGIGPKGGVMVRAALDYASPFEACMLKWEGSAAYGSLRVGNKRCTARGNEPTDGKDIISGQGAWKISVGKEAGWVRIRRTGSVITCSYRQDSGGPWTDAYRLDDTAGAYGDTVYVGLATSSASTAAGMIPGYDWRFSNIRIRTPKGSVLSLR